MRSFTPSWHGRYAGPAMRCGAGVGVLGLTMIILGDVVASGARIDSDAVSGVVVFGPLFGSLGGLFLAAVAGLLIPLDTNARIARRSRTRSFSASW